MDKLVEVCCIVGGLSITVGACNYQEVFLSGQTTRIILAHVNHLGFKSASIQFLGHFLRAALGIPSLRPHQNGDGKCGSILLGNPASCTRQHLAEKSTEPFPLLGSEWRVLWNKNPVRHDLETRPPPACQRIRRIKLLSRPLNGESLTPSRLGEQHCPISWKAQTLRTLSGSTSGSAKGLTRGISFPPDHRISISR